MNIRYLGFLIVGVVSVTACGLPETDPPGSSAVETPLLKPLGSCQAVQQALRVMAVSRMHREVDTQLELALERGSIGCYGGGSRGYDDAYNGAPTAGSKTSTSGGGSEGAKSVSTTNNQVAGVDEADFIKNDNEYIYVVNGQELRIFQAWPVAEARELARLTLEGVPRKLFVAGNRALVYSSMSSSSSSSKTSGGYGYQRRECTYGYNCSFTGDGYPTMITVIDISDRTRPKKVRELKLSGSYVNARRVGNAVYTVISTPGAEFPKLSTSPVGFKCKDKLSQEKIELAFEQLRHENELLLINAKLEDWMPTIKDHILFGNAKGHSDVMAKCKGFFQSSISDGDQFTTLLGLDMSQESTPSASTIVSRPGAVYASAKALYISVPRQKSSNYGWYRSMSSVDEVSTVHKFQLKTSEAMAAYAASGLVKGKVLNQFAMDEHNNYLRIATTTGRVPSSKVHSTMTVLRHTGKQLKRAGQVDQLAPKEDIRSVRFDGTRGYVVTFKKTDPLFVFDLSNPNNPRVMAELKIPGFSTYMHMMDKKHLMTIGYDANDQGSFAWFTGVRFQIFDVSNISKPTLVHKMVIGTRGSSSAALNNHLAFNYFSPKKMLAVPMTVCDAPSGSSGGAYGKNMSFSGLMVFDTTAQSGFKLRGQVAHPAGSGVSCSNWWTNARSQVERSIFMDDYVFSISREVIKVNHLNSLSTDIASLPLK